MSDPSAPPSYGDAVTEKKYQNPAAPYRDEGGLGGYSVQQTPEYPPANSSVPETTVYTTPQFHSPHPLDVDGEGGGFTIRQSFSDKDVRRMFVRKVFIILAIQLLVTFGIICVFTLVDNVRNWVKYNPSLYYAAYAVFLVMYFVLVCVESARRKHPYNLIMLGLFTLALSYLTGTIAATYDIKAVMTGFGVTVVVCVAVIIFSMQTKFDFTKCSGLLFVLLWVLFLFGFITIFTYSYNWYLQIVYGCLGALVFTLFLAFDTQLVMGGKRHELDPEEYVFGALTLYIDIIYIFLFLLSIFGGGSRS